MGVYIRVPIYPRRYAPVPHLPGRYIEVEYEDIQNYIYLYDYIRLCLTTIGSFIAFRLLSVCFPPVLSVPMERSERCVLR